MRGFLTQEPLFGLRLFFVVVITFRRRGQVHITARRQADIPAPKGSNVNLGESPQLDPLKFSNKLSMPSVRQPLDEPGAPAPTVVMPRDSGFTPKLVPDTQGAQPAASGK